MPTATFYHQLKSDFVAHGGQICSPGQDASAQGEKPGHGVPYVDEGPGQQRRRLAVDPTEQTPPLVGAAAQHVPAGQHEVDCGFGQARQQTRDGFRRMA